MSSSSLHVTLEPFHPSTSSASSAGPTFLTLSGDLAPIHTGGSGSSGASGGAGLQRDASLHKDQWNAPLSSPTGVSSAMDTSGDGASGGNGSGGGAATTKPEGKDGGSSSGSGSGTSVKDGAKDSKEGGGSHGPKDAKYLDNFLASISDMPEWVREKIGRIKGLERAILAKSAALKDASQYHVSMIHAKLTPLKKSEGDAAAAAAATAAMPPPASAAAAAAAATSGAAVTAAAPASATGAQSSMGAPPLSADLSGSGANSTPRPGTESAMGTSTSASTTLSSLPPLPVPSPLSAPLPYSLIPAVVAPLPTENLLNNLTYLLVGPAIHAQTMLQGHPALSAGGSGSGSGSLGPAGSPLSLSKQEMGVMPMNLTPTAAAPVGKKLAVQTISAQSHHFASIPSAAELASTAVAPLPVDPPALPRLANESLELRRRFPTPAEYDLDDAEKLMKEHQQLMIDWQKQKATLVNELAEQIEALQKRAEAAIKKFESKIRRGNFEVPATPIDRRRGPGAAATAATASASTTAASASAAGSSAASASTSSAASAGASATAASLPGTGAGGGGGVDSSRKRTYASLVQEMEAREIQYQLQHELRTEIEKQSASAIAAAHAQAAASAGAAAGGSGGGGASGASGSGSGVASSSPPGEVGEPVYCICKKVSFGSMVACDNDDCPIEWYHFSCVGLEVKPTGKWFCPDCRQRSKQRKTSNAKAKKDK